MNEVFGDGLANRMVLYIPSTANVNQSITQEHAEQWVEAALRLLSTLFGGATAIRAVGSWVSHSDTLVTENVTIVYAFADELSTKKLTAVKQFALKLKRELGQESVAVEVNGKLYLL
jgi:hypothetical protein